MIQLYSRLIAAALFSAAALSWAQGKPQALQGNYPNKPIRVIVPASPEQLHALFNRDIDKWTKLFARMKVKL